MILLENYSVIHSLELRNVNDFAMNVISQLESRKSQQRRDIKVLPKHATEDSKVVSFKQGHSRNDSRHFLKFLNLEMTKGQKISTLPQFNLYLCKPYEKRFVSKM